MATDSQKKQIERWTLEQLRALLPSFPPGDVIPGEEPDFTLVLDDGRKVGVELTELHRKVLPGKIPPQSQEALKHRAVKRAQDIYDSTKNPYLHVSVHFANIELSKSDIPRLAQKIADLVGSVIPPPGEARVAEPDYGSQNNFPEEFHRVSAYNLPSAERSFFTAPGATWVATLQSDDIRRALSSKDGKYARYRGQTDEVWLVVSCNTGFMSTWFEGVDQFHERVFETKFDRVFILSLFDGRVIEIRRQGTTGD
jgi:hypothetical protein